MINNRKKRLKKKRGYKGDFSPLHVSFNYVTVDVFKSAKLC